MVVSLDPQLDQDDNPLVSSAHQRIKDLGIPYRRPGRDTTADAGTITLLIPVVPTMEHPAKFAEVKV